MILAASNPFDSAYANQTTIHPMGLAMVLLMGVAILAVPRRYALWPVIVITCFVASAQRMVLLGADFTLLRLMVLFGTARVVSYGEWRGFRWNMLDYGVLAWALFSVVVAVFRLGPAVLMNKLGYCYDVVGMYFLFRCVIRDLDDYRALVRGLKYATLVVAGFVFLEWSTGKNMFSVFGGVPEVTKIRDGKLRCQGAFAHPILTGCFFAGLIPLFVADLWQVHRRRLTTIAAIGAAMFVVVACNSSTPLTAVVFAAIGGLTYFLRYRMRWVRWGLVITAVILHLVMFAPVWHLVARMNLGGGSSWHRFVLIDGAIRHWDEWFLNGSDVGTAHWGHFAFDVTNMYIVQAVQGGIVQLGLFIAVIALAAGQVGRAWRRAAPDKGLVILFWGLGVSLFVHATNHFGVSYFGQIWMGWFLILAVIGSLCPAAGFLCRTPSAGDAWAVDSVARARRKRVGASDRRPLSPTSLPSWRTGTTP